MLPSNASSLETYLSHAQAGCSSYVLMTQERNLSQALRQSEPYLKQRIEYYLSIFFNHLYYSEEVEHDIEIEGKKRVMLGGSTRNS